MSDVECGRYAGDVIVRTSITDGVTIERADPRIHATFGALSLGPGEVDSQGRLVLPGGATYRVVGPCPAGHGAVHMQRDGDASKTSQWEESP